MQRELRPDLFQNFEDTGSKASQNPNTGSPDVHEDWDLQNMKSELKQLRHYFEHSKQRMDQLEQKIEASASQFQEFMRTTSLRLERLTSAVQKTQEQSSQALHGLQADFAAVRGRVNERRLSEGKVEELMDRQNMMIRNFESRMAALQKLVADKEMKLMNFAGLLDDARREIQRIKGY